jgi:hypothetical protein
MRKVPPGDASTETQQRSSVAPRIADESLGQAPSTPISPSADRSVTFFAPSRLPLFFRQPLAGDSWGFPGHVPLQFATSPSRLRVRTAKPTPRIAARSDLVRFEHRAPKSEAAGDSSQGASGTTQKSKRPAPMRRAALDQRIAESALNGRLDGRKDMEPHEYLRVNQF